MKNSEDILIKTSSFNTNTNNNTTVTDYVSEAILQITYADRIIINKIDLITQDELTILFQAIKLINKNARILACEYSNLPIDELLNIRAFDPYENKSLLNKYDENHRNSNNKNNNNSHYDDDDDRDDINQNSSNKIDDDSDMPKIFTTDKNGKIITKKQNLSNITTQKKRTTLNYSKYNKNALQIIKQKNFKHNISSVSLVIYDKPLDLVLFNSFITKLLKEDGFLIYRLKGKIC